MAISYQVDYGRLRGHARREAFRIIKKATDETRDVARRNVLYRKHPGVPPRPIGLANSLFAIVRPTTDGWRGTVGSWLSYAASVEEGAAPHTIVPRASRGPNARLVFWWTKRNTLFVGPIVHHPGQRGKSYLRRALVQVAPRYGFRVTIL